MQGIGQRQTASLTGGYVVKAGIHTLSLCGAGAATGTVVYGPSLTAMFSPAGAVPAS